MICDDQKLGLFRNVFKQHYHKIVYYSQKFLKNEEDARDVAQATFQTYWENIERIDGEPLQFLFTTARNRCLNILRRQKYKDTHRQAVLKESAGEKLDIMSLSDSCIDHLLSEEIVSMVEKCLESLPEKSREAFRLSREKGLTYKEIATLQGVSVKNIEYRISSVLRLLRQKMDKYR